jgi:hypothetical protein
MQPSEQWEEGIEIDGFDEVVVKARSPGAAVKHIRIIGRYSNNEDILQLRVTPDLVGDLKAVHPGKTDIQQDDIGPTGSGRSQDRAAIMDGLHVETGEAEEERKAPCQVSIIIRDEDEEPPPEKVHCRSNLD